ncbi:murein biosynthesis integral membrane protein MurJ [Streptomyces sp. ST2-7A]|nr:murein biosynthesis integral membrane protein MurJ [Streptomyces sp. ST2-7A]MCE7081496.1 murein biosynthesis integral membrane protein MurJ [Streptomyces sp. ST2-7A]
MAQDPVDDTLYDRAAHPPPSPGSAPDPRAWTPPPAPEPGGAPRSGPYGSRPAADGYPGTPGPPVAAQTYGGPDADHGTGGSRPHPVGPPPRPYPPMGTLPPGGPAGPRAHAGPPPPPHRTDHPGHPGYPGPGEPADPRQPNGAEEEPGRDAFAHLYRDQREVGPTAPAGPGGAAAPGAVPPVAAATTGGPAEPPSIPEPVAEPRKPGRGSSLLKSSAVMAAGTLVSRITGFVRQLIIVAALGAAVLGDTYAIAWALPSMIYILTIGGGLNSVFVPQLVRSMKNDEDGGEAYANRLLTLVMVVLAALVLIAVLIAPLLIRMMSAKIASDPAANEVAVTFARYCLPTIFFMGVHVVMGQILNARDRFGPMMWTPVLNNIVVIATFGLFLWVHGTQRASGVAVDTITPEGIRLLGIGTLLGLVVQSLAMIPYLRAAGFRVRPRFDWVGQGMGKAMRLAKWTVLFVFANQIGLVVISQLATWAGDNAERAGFPGTGFLAYSSALLIWQMPQAIITVSVMAALLPRISRSAADGDNAAVRDDLSQGLRTSAVAIVPIAFAFVALGVPMCTLLFGSAGDTAARSFGHILMAFGIGLIPFSAQYVVLRAFYAYEDTRTPFYNTVIVSLNWIALSVLSFVLLPDRWVVAGIAFSYGVAYTVGVGIAWRRLRSRMGTDLDGARVVRTYIRLCGAAIPAAVPAGVAAWAIMEALGSGVVGSLLALAGGGVILAVVFVLAARRMRIEELTTLIGMVRSRLGR